MISVSVQCVLFLFGRLENANDPLLRKDVQLAINGVYVYFFCYTVTLRMDFIFLIYYDMLEISILG